MLHYYSVLPSARFGRILDVILECGQSIHDISRVQLDSASSLPRFNMPLELGADLGLRLKGPPRQRDRRLLILESETHRYDITSSDLSGQDIEAHHNDESEIIARIRDWLNAHREGEDPLPGAEAIKASYAAYHVIAPNIAADADLDPLDRLSHTDFLWTIYMALDELGGSAAAASSRGA